MYIHTYICTRRHKDSNHRPLKFSSISPFSNLYQSLPSFRRSQWRFDTQFRDVDLIICVLCVISYYYSVWIFWIYYWTLINIVVTQVGAIWVFCNYLCVLNLYGLWESISEDNVLHGPLKLWHILLLLIYIFSFISLHVK